MMAATSPSRPLPPALSGRPRRYELLPVEGNLPLGCLESNIYAAAEIPQISGPRRGRDEPLALQRRVVQPSNWQDDPISLASAELVDGGTEVSRRG